MLICYIASFKDDYPPQFNIKLDDFALSLPSLRDRSYIIQEELLPFARAMRNSRNMLMGHKIFVNFFMGYTTLSYQILIS